MCFYVLLHEFSSFRSHPPMSGRQSMFGTCLQRMKKRSLWSAAPGLLKANASYVQPGMLFWWADCVIKVDYMVWMWISVVICLVCSEKNKNINKRIWHHRVNFVLPALVVAVSLFLDKVDSDLPSFCHCVSGVWRGNVGHVVGDQNEPSEHGAILSCLSDQ